MSLEASDDLTRELRRLRQGRGLTHVALAAAPAILASLGNRPLPEAFDTFSEHVVALGTDERATALRHAYGIGMENPGMLTERRADLHVATGRDVKTLAAYENQMIAELATRLAGRDRVEVDGSTVIVEASILDDYISSLQVTVLFTALSGQAQQRTVEYVNNAASRSLPALVYQLPGGWEPRLLILSVHNTGKATYRFWASPGLGLLDIMFATYAAEVPLIDERANMQVEGPKEGVLYSIFWTPG